MTLDRRVVALQPCMPYSLSQSLYGTAGGTRRRRGAIWDICLRVGERDTMVSVHQLPDGVLEVEVDEDVASQALDGVRHVLATDVDHRPFLERFEDDRLIGRAVRSRRGVRPARFATVGHALLAAFAGQLVTDAEAQNTQRALIARLDRSGAYPRRPPLLTEIGALPPAAAAADGLSAQRAASLIRVSRRIRPSRLAALSTADASARLQTERDVGPWTAGIVLGEGLGRQDIGRVGDLGLVRLCERLNGRPATVQDTAELLEPYGEWQGLASAHLLRIAASGPRRRPPPRRRQ